MEIGSAVKIITNRGSHKGIVSNISENENTTVYTGYIQGLHFFEIVHVKKDNHYAGDVSWDRKTCKHLDYTASFIESFSEVEQVAH
jgi:hypothetical protein